MERTFIMVKPDGVARHLVGDIVARFESKGLKCVGAKLMTISEDLAKTHYQEHTERPFFNDLVSFITSGPVFAMVWEGDDVVTISRTMIGATNPKEATPGSIRGDFAASLDQNVIHGSDSVESAEREIGLFFSTTELVF